MSGLVVAGFRLTHHAAERMVEMGLTCDDLAAVLRNYANRYSSNRYGEGRFVYQLGSIAVATAERHGESPVVVTVLWNRKERWHRDTAAAGSLESTT